MPSRRSSGRWRYRRQQAVSTVPLWATAIVMVSFAAGGTALPVPYTDIWRVGAGVAAVMCITAALVPKRDDCRMAAAVASTVWFFSWGAHLIGYVVTDGKGPLSVFSLLLAPLVAVLIAWSWGRSSVLRPASSRLLQRTHSSGENVSPHFSPAKGSRPPGRGGPPLPLEKNDPEKDR